MTLFIFVAVYFLVLFWIAYQGNDKRAEKLQNSSWVYTLSLAVFCTAWTYYGNIGITSSNGILPFALYIGATFGLIILAPLIKRMIKIKTQFHSTSLADFISARYEQSRWVAALVTILCLIGIIPYISIQIKPMIETFIATSIMIDGQWFVIYDYLDLLLVLLLGVFTILFGIRKLDPTERHPGIMVALAADSLFKLIIALVAGAAICIVASEELLQVLQNTAITNNQEAQVFQQPPAIDHWFSLMLLGAIGIIILPRQFHVSIVECTNTSLIDKAKWQLPLYLILINLFVFPVAIIGQQLVPNAVSKDLLLLLIPIDLDMPILAIFVYLGGLAASSGMVVISCMTLSTMTTNHLLLPIIEKYKPINRLKSHLLPLRWISVFIILFVSLIYYRLISDSYLLVQTGTISFVATAQFAPALIGGLLWRGATKKGALAAITGGALVWFYTTMLPPIIQNIGDSQTLLTQGPFGLRWLAPQGLFGSSGLTPVAHSLFWSLSVNISLLIFVSKLTQPKSSNLNEQYFNASFFDEETEQPMNKMAEINSNLANDIWLLTKTNSAIELFKDYMDNKTAHNKVKQACIECKLASVENINILQLSQLTSCLTRKLAGVTGMAAANYAVRNTQLLNVKEQELLSSYYAKLISQLQISPTELIEKVNFYQEKQKLLEDHSKQQLATIEQLKEQINSRQQAEASLQELNEHLELRVLERTQQLKDANDDLQQTLESLNSTQHKLVEAEKMASLTNLVAGIAHEINTPAGTILTSVSLVSEQITEMQQMLADNKITKGQLNQFLQNLLECSQLELRNVNRIATLIDCFKLINVEANRETRQNFKLIDCFDSSLASCQKRLEAHKIAVVVNCKNDLQLFGFPHTLSQVLINLIENSIEHGFKDQSSGQIQLSANIKGQELLVEYQDNGIGIDEENQHRLFEPFYTTARSEGKLGLGAHIVFNLVTQKLGGAINIQSLPSSGLSLLLSLPLGTK